MKASVSNLPTSRTLNGLVKTIATLARVFPSFSREDCIALRFKSVRRGAIRHALGKLVVAVAVALFFVVLGIVADVGYHSRLLAYSINQERTPAIGGGGTIINISSIMEATFNPVLHPLHWLTGRGYWLEQRFSMTQNVQAGMPWGYKGYGGGSADDIHYPQSGWRGYVSQQDYYENCAADMASWELLGNLTVLLSITASIEILNHRFLYLVLLAGIFGFSLGGITGTAIGLVTGIIFFLILKLRPGKEDIFTRLWSYFWEKNNNSPLD